MPTWLQGPHITIIRTHNGWAVAPAPNTPIEQCVAFETWDAMTYWLGANFAVTPA